MCNIPQEENILEGATLNVISMGERKNTIKQQNIKINGI